ncbi:hypothetical protein ABZ642_14610 [Streptomyces sp. NPDC007157]|uniref:hypothetical protein n=1 Tax=Streptomyces sp. NPDC007157 TaxID=3154681 RepID=UPI0033E774FF
MLTRTVKVRAAARNTVFDEYLRTRVTSEATDLVPFEAVDDHGGHRDGRLRGDGASGPVAARGVHLPDGMPDDSWEVRNA